VFEAEVNVLDAPVLTPPTAAYALPSEKHPFRKIIRRKPGTKPNNYFDERTQQFIVDYKNEPDVEKKKTIYVKGILPAFDSLVENLINVYGFSVLHESKSDLKNECLEFLYGAVSKFDPTKGSKAFSYFNVVAKHWLTIKAKQNTKKSTNYISIDNKDEISKDDLEAIENFQIIPSYEDVAIARENQALFEKILDEIQLRVRSENELVCLQSVRALLFNIDDVDLLSKRAVLLYIREISNLSSKQLSIALSSLKKHYKEIRKLELFEY
jgi:hypothetical protein